MIEVISERVDGDRMTRRPADLVPHHRFTITERERFRWGIVERIVAVKTNETFGDLLERRWPRQTYTGEDDDLLPRRSASQRVGGTGAATVLPGRRE
jgi:hypothetical protein